MDGHLAGALTSFAVLSKEVEQLPLVRLVMSKDAATNNQGRRKVEVFARFGERGGIQVGSVGGSLLHVAGKGRIGAVREMPFGSSILAIAIPLPLL